MNIFFIISWPEIYDVLKLSYVLRPGRQDPKQIALKKQSDLDLHSPPFHLLLLGPLPYGEKKPIHFR